MKRDRHREVICLHFHVLNRVHQPFIKLETFIKSIQAVVKKENYANTPLAVKSFPLLFGQVVAQTAGLLTGVLQDTEAIITG